MNYILEQLEQLFYELCWVGPGVAFLWCGCSAPPQPPHPPFGHLLPRSLAGEKDESVRPGQRAQSVPDRDCSSACPRPRMEHPPKGTRALRATLGTCKRRILAGSARREPRGSAFQGRASERVKTDFNNRHSLFDNHQSAVGRSAMNYILEQLESCSTNFVGSARESPFSGVDALHRRSPLIRPSGTFSPARSRGRRTNYAPRFHLVFACPGQTRLQPPAAACTSTINIRYSTIINPRPALASWVGVDIAPGPNLLATSCRSIGLFALRRCCPLIRPPGTFSPARSRGRRTMSAAIASRVRASGTAAPTSSPAASVQQLGTCYLNLRKKD